MDPVRTETQHEPSLQPPVNSIGVVRWLKENLFSSWFNTLLTILASIVTFYILKGTLTFIFVTGDWSVISTNFKLLIVGQYPQDQVWRIWISFSLVVALLGVSWGTWRGSIKIVALTIGGLMLISAALPFIQSETRVWLIADLALLGVAYFFGKKFGQRLKKLTYVLWALYFPITIFLLNGFGVFKPVSTSLWSGFLLTLIIAQVAIVCSFPFGVLLALGRRSKLAIIRWFCIAYIELIRGIPLITLLFVAKFMMPLFLGNALRLDDVLRVMIAFTMFSAAYLAENVRGGLQSIPRGQVEAAQALGLNSTYSTFFIVLPQALRAVIPAMVGQFIAIFKDTSLVAIVALTDLLGMGKKIVANPAFLGKQLEVFLFVALIFFIFCYLMSLVSRRLEVSLGVGKR